VARLCESKVFDDLPAPDAFGVVNGMAEKLDRLKAIGNGQVPQCAATAFRILSGE
jgi:DNA (cytosine-5)-methyltransferase 1